MANVSSDDLRWALVASYKAPPKLPWRALRKTDIAINDAATKSNRFLVHSDGVGYEPSTRTRDVWISFRSKMDLERAKARIRRVGVPGLKLKTLDMDKPKRAPRRRR